MFYLFESSTKSNDFSQLYGIKTVVGPDNNSQVGGGIYRRANHYILQKYLSERVINVLNQLPESADFSSLSLFTRNVDGRHGSISLFAMVSLV